MDIDAVIQQEIEATQSMFEQFENVVDTAFESTQNALNYINVQMIFMKSIIDSAKVYAKNNEYAQAYSRLLEVTEYFVNLNKVIVKTYLNTKDQTKVIDND